MTKILSPYWVTDKLIENLHVAAAARHARLQWDHSLMPMCHRGTTQQPDTSYGIVAVRISKDKTYTV